MVLELDDFITLATPEGIELEMSLAGAGSRMLAGTIDLLLQLVLIVCLLVALAAAGGFGAALSTIAAFLVLFGYDVLFEVLGRGRTPGKRMCGLRVVRSDGSPVDLQSSAARNIARLIDGPPLFYIPTVVGILATANNQRPGDLAGDTIVIRTPRRPRRGQGEAAPAGRLAPPVAVDWDVSAISADELAVVRRFLERRETLQDGPRDALAMQLAEGLRPRVTGAAPHGSAEGFLETLLAAKGARGARLARRAVPGGPPQAE